MSPPLECIFGHTWYLVAENARLRAATSTNAAAVQAATLEGQASKQEL